MFIVSSPFYEIASRIEKGREIDQTMANSRIQPLLMFQGKAEEAMNFYVSLFPDAEVRDVARYGPKESGVEGSIKKASFSFGSQSVIFIDSAVKHDFSFTPAFSFFVDFESEDDIDRLYSELSAGGTVFMPIGNHGFSCKFAWLNDRFGVSWQLNLA